MNYFMWSVHTNCTFRTLESLSKPAIHASMQLLKYHIYISFKFSSIPSHLKNHRYFWIITILKTAATDFFQNNNLQAFRKEVCAHHYMNIVLYQVWVTAWVQTKCCIQHLEKLFLHSHVTIVSERWPTCISSRLLWWTKVTLKIDCAFCF